MGKSRPRLAFPPQRCEVGEAIVAGKLRPLGNTRTAQPLADRDGRLPVAPRRPRPAPPEARATAGWELCAKPAVEGGRGEDAERRHVTQAQLRESRPIPAVVLVEHVSHSDAPAEPSLGCLWRPAACCPRWPRAAPPDLAPRPAGCCAERPAVEHGRGEEGGRRHVAQTQLRQLRPIPTSVTAEHVGRSDTPAEPSHW